MSNEQLAMKDVRRESLSKGVSCWRLKEFGRDMLAKGESRWFVKDIRRINREQNRKTRKGIPLFMSFACFRAFRG
jgi:hypothetical protein